MGNPGTGTRDAVTFCITSEEHKPGQKGKTTSVLICTKGKAFFRFLSPFIEFHILPWLNLILPNPQMCDNKEVLHAATSNIFRPPKTAAASL